MITKTPNTLLGRLCDGPSQRDWERFVQLFTPLLERWFVRFGIPSADIEDLLQELFSVLVVQFTKFQYDPNRSFRAWLFTISRRLALSWNQRKMRLGEAQGGLSDLVEKDLLQAFDEQEYSQFILERGLALVQKDFEESTWQIFRAVAIEGKTGAEVAEQFGTTPNAVYLIRGRVLARLRMELKDFRE